MVFIHNATGWQIQIVYEYTIVYMNALKLGQDKYKGVIMTSSGNTCQIDCYFVDNIKPIRIAMLITISR